MAGKGKKPTDRTLVVGTWPTSIAEAATEPPPEPDEPTREADPWATRLETPGIAPESRMAEPTEQDAATADTHRGEQEESTANTRPGEPEPQQPAHWPPQQVAPPTRQPARAQAAPRPPPQPQWAEPRAAQPPSTADTVEAKASDFQGFPKVGEPPVVKAPQAKPAPAPKPKPAPKAQAKPPPGPSAELAAVARGLAQKARRLLKKRQYDEALSCAHKAMGIDRFNSEYAALCGYLVHLSGATASGLIDQCLALFDRAIELDAQNAGAHYQKGLVLAESGRTREALVHFERTLDLNPDHLDAARHIRNLS